MAQTYAKLQQQIAQLQKAADAQRSKEIGAVVNKIRALVSEWQLKPEDVFPELRQAQRSPRTTKTGTRVKPKAAAIRYADGTGNTWGGIGKRPRWLQVALSAGRSLDEFAVQGVAGKRRSAETEVPKAKSTSSQPRYRDENGNTWIGRGIRPRWLKDALAAGKTLEQLAV